MIHRFRYESHLDRLERQYREARLAKIKTVLLVLVLTGAVWLLLRTVAARGGWMAIF